MPENRIHIDLGLTAPQFLRRLDGNYADRPALIFDGATWTYRDLHDEVRRIQAALLALGVNKGTRVALLMGPRPEWVATAFATMSIGAVFIPLSTYEPATKIEQILRHSDASVLIVQDRLLRHQYLDDLVGAHPGLLESDGTYFDQALPCLRQVVNFGDSRLTGHVLNWSDFLSNAITLPAGYLDALEDEIHPTDDALVIYTSGTSGPSKGVIHTHRTVVVQFERIPAQFTLTSDDVVWGTFPLFWSAGIAWQLGGTLGAGASLVLQEVFSPHETIKLIEKHGVTVMHALPSHITQMEEALAESPTDVTSLRIIPRGALSEYVDLPPDHVFGGASLGLTETLTIAACIPWDSPLELRNDTHGRPLPGMSLKIIDSVTGETLPTGESGEIALKGTVLMRGYHKAFPETYLDDQSFYRTSDTGFIDHAGYLHFTGRMSQVIRVNSANVSPTEVESALHELPDVKIAAVLGIPDPAAGEIVVACVVPRAGATATEASIRSQLKERLAGYKIPRRILFLEESDIPMTSTGKAIVASLRPQVEAILARRADK